MTKPPENTKALLKFVEEVRVLTCERLLVRYTSQLRGHEGIETIDPKRVSQTPSREHTLVVSHWVA